MSADEGGIMDGDLIAYLNGALPTADRLAIEARLATDADLRRRLDELTRIVRPVRAAFDTLLAEAPRERLDAMLSDLLATPTNTEPRPVPAPASWRRYGPWALAIAASLVLLVVGAAIDRFAVPPTNREVASETGNWRQAVAEYWVLNTSDTLSTLPENPSATAADLAASGGKLGLPLTPDRLALSGLTLKRTELFQYANAPLAQIAYLDPANGPVAFCIIGRSKGTASFQSEQRQGMNIVYWSSKDHSFLLIGHAPTADLTTLAQSLSDRVAS